MLGVREFADHHCCPQLSDSCMRFIQKHFIDVSKSDEFLNQLTADQLASIIEQDDLNVRSEEQVIHGL